MPSTSPTSLLEALTEKVEFLMEGSMVKVRPSRSKVALTLAVEPSTVPKAFFSSALMAASKSPRSVMLWNLSRLMVLLLPSMVTVRDWPEINSPRVRFLVMLSGVPRETCCLPSSPRSPSLSARLPVAPVMATVLPAFFLSLTEREIVPS